MLLPLLAALAILALTAGIFFWRLAHIHRASTGLPFNAKVVYADTGAWRKVEQPLISRRYALTGKPDYIIEQNGLIVPVEVKPTRTASAPRESDVMQLTAYGLLVEETMAHGRVVPHGLLKYRDTVFQIDFTAELRGDLISLMESMRRDATESDVARSHAETWRCRACGYRAECDQVL